MKKAVYIGMAVLAIACGRGTQESRDSSPAGAAARAGTADASNQPSVTLTGCLQNADRPAGAEPTGTSGTAEKPGAKPGSAAGERFTLTNATSADANASSPAASYILDGDMESLRTHVNAKVRVEGKLDAAASNTAGPQHVRVTSVEPVAPSCSDR